MNSAKDSLQVFPCWIMAAWLLSFVALAAANGADQPAASAGVQIDRARLQDKRFQFSWKSAEGSGVNGIAWLKPDGSVRGINNPNETSWLVDASGRLLFKHADGRASTRYDKVQLIDGLLRFEGPFLFREGITHHLIEVGGAEQEPDHQITPSRAARIKYSTQRFLYLDPGETVTFRLKDGTEKRIRLVSVNEEKDSVVGLTRRAQVQVEVEGKPVELTCAPYVMPTETSGLRIQADTTSAWLAIPKRVQFSLWDASDPIVDTNLFGFPLPGYRLFSHGMQAYNEPVHLGDRDGDPAGQRFYHNYGVDLAGCEGRQKVVSCINGMVVQADSREGNFAVRDDRGLVLYFGHLDSILSGMRPGATVQRGQWIGMLGRRGASGNFSHLHVGVYRSEADMPGDRLSRNLNLYPWLVAAYQAGCPRELHAVAGPHQVALTGDRVRFNGGNSLAGQADITAFRWEFHDGTAVNGPKAEKAFEKPGCYMAALWVKDSRSAVDVDFCRVRVFSRSKPEDVVPTLFVTCKPSEEAGVNEPVNFRLWPQGRDVEDIWIDFADGTKIENYRPYSAVTHKFTAPGIHVVTVTGKAGALPVTQKVKVIVR
jgi:murein DD-endopeptidase MepM/ murein hydrolase activator NlpD